MFEPPRPRFQPVQLSGDWRNKRLIILGVILFAVFVVWIVTMLAPFHFGSGH